MTEYDYQEKRISTFYLNRYELKLMSSIFKIRKVELRLMEDNEENETAIRHLDSMREGLEKLLKNEGKREMITIRIEKEIEKDEE